jgi:hypothetical protein
MSQVATRLVTVNRFTGRRVYQQVRDGLLVKSNLLALDALFV